MPLAMGGAELARETRGVEYILKAYASGVPLFPRSLLEDLDRQLALNGDCVYINNIDNIPQEHYIKVPSVCGNSRPASDPHGSLTNLRPASPGEELHFELNAITISYTKHIKPPKFALSEVTSAFGQARQAWQKSDACRSLKQHLATATFSVSINKIVCFGLGSLTGTDKPHPSRSNTQHAAVETMAEVLKERSGRSIHCYAQEPEYNAVDKEFLETIKITPVDDPKGFLEVDANTLVISVNPNVPVKQIIADIQWPAAMLWNTVEPEEAETREWEKMESGAWLSCIARSHHRYPVPKDEARIIDQATNTLGDLHKPQVPPSIPVEL
ncbi:uncharacterized protein BP5553_07134 [Venustampulla echinocandica]|uniref:SRR1-like domain-containing protein n=1 Tax=Venustampulla echinocandica TaxID=2656787 RepID=A0A370TIM3_9HELO|nr:uncharacterized protein BP5553_07134 [Venustampulla echinocandica]RDL35203.1 hypothetical protein BP5553_07134 [Venustampulla echinocandica]